MTSAPQMAPTGGPGPSCPEKMAAIGGHFFPGILSLSGNKKQLSIGQILLFQGVGLHHIPGGGTVGLGDIPKALAAGDHPQHNGRLSVV